MMNIFLLQQLMVHYYNLVIHINKLNINQNTLIENVLCLQNNILLVIIKFLHYQMYIFKSNKK